MYVMMTLVAFGGLMVVAQLKPIARRTVSTKACSGSASPR